MADRIGVGKAFLNDLLSRIPESRRAAVAETFEDPEAQAALELVGDGVLRQQDYSRKLNEVDQYKATLDDWYATNQARLAAAPMTPPANDRGNPNPPAPAGLTRQEAEKLIGEREMGVAAFVAASNALTLKHFQAFGEVLDITELMKDPKVGEVGLLGVYDQKFKPRYDERAAAAETARITKAVEDGIAERMKTMRSAPPYPVVGNGDTSPLDVLDNPDAAKPFSAQSAADEYTTLVAQRMQREAVGR